MKARYFIVLISLAFSGCSLIYSYSDNLPQRIDSLVNEKRYNVALNTIDYIKPSHKDFKLIQRKKKNILRQMHNYQDEIIELSGTLATQGDWIAALNELDAAAKNITNTEKINQHRSNLLAKRDKIISAYENELLIIQATNLASKVDIYEKIKKTVDANEKNDLGLGEFEKQRYDISKKLAQQSESHYKKGNYNKANDIIILALKINTDKDIAARLDRIKTSIKKEHTRKLTAYVSEAKLLLKKLSQGYSHDILKETKDKITWLGKNMDNKNSYSDLISKLQWHLTAGVKQRFEAGRKLYSEGKTQEALSIWRELSELQPEHPKLRSHIKRAEKILNKLDTLSNKPVNKK